MTETPNVGDRVRVTIVREGLVRSAGENRIVLDDGYTMNRSLDVSFNRTIEILERAKPTWQDGDVARYRGRMGVANLRFLRAGEWFDVFGGFCDSLGTETHWGYVKVDDPKAL